jgi:hypothetical protein
MKKIIGGIAILLFTAGCGSDGSGGSAGIAIGTQAQVNLDSYYNQAGFFSDGTVYSSALGFDLSGWSYPSAELGTHITYDGFDFSLGAVASNDVVSCSGAAQTISLPSGRYSKILLLASAIGFGTSQVTLTVHYTDSTSSSYVQNFSDWVNTSTEVGQTAVASTTHRNFHDGASDTNPAYVYGYSFTLDATKGISSFEVPLSSVRIIALAVIP